MLHKGRKVDKPFFKTDPNLIGSLAEAELQDTRPLYLPRQLHLQLCHQFLEGRFQPESTATVTKTRTGLFFTRPNLLEAKSHSLRKTDIETSDLPKGPQSPWPPGSRRSCRTAREHDLLRTETKQRDTHENSSATWSGTFYWDSGPWNRYVALFHSLNRLYTKMQSQPRSGKTKERLGICTVACLRRHLGSLLRFRT